jgi:shikimate dehydrogenase
MTITGRTRVVAVLADPIAQVRSIALLNEHRLFREHDVVAIPAQVPASGLPGFLEAARSWRNLAGLMVSIPHKVDAAALVDALDARAAAGGTVNVIRRSPDGTLAGTCTDGLGFVRNLEAHGVSVPGLRALLVGTGGAARAIAAELAARGAAHVGLAGRSADRAGEAASAVGDPVVVAEGDASAPGGYDLVVNATPLGLAPGDPLPFDPGRTSPHAVVCDIVMPADDSRLVLAARAAGRVAIDGRGMLARQLDANAAYALGL